MAFFNHAANADTSAADWQGKVWETQAAMQWDFGKLHRLISCLIRGGGSHICGTPLANWQLIDQLVNYLTNRLVSQSF